MRLITRQTAARRQVVAQLPVDETEELHIARAERGAGISLLDLPFGDKGGDVGVTVPGALGAVGADAHRDVRAGVGPLGERRAAPELDVVGMGADRKHALWGCEIDGDRHVRDLSRIIWRVRRSSSMSTSKPSSGSRTIRTARPQRRASSAWRAAESGP